MREARKRRTPGKEGNTPMARGTDGHGTHEDARDKAFNKDENKTKTKKNQH